MFRFGIVLALVLAHGEAAFAASVINFDEEPRTILVTEDGNVSEYVIAAGKTIAFCPTGCFVKMPDGKREVLTGFETIEILGGVGRVR